MKINRRQFLQLTGATLAASALPSAVAADLTLWGPPVTPTVLLAVAAQQGEARKIRPFRVQSWKGPDQLRAGLLSKSIEISIVPSYVAANLRAQGQPVLLYNSMTTGLLAVLSKGGRIESVKELVGKKLVMPFKNDMPDLVLQILAKKAGVDLGGQITYTATPPEAVLLFLKQKDLDYALLPEPLASAALLQAKKLNVAVERSFAIDKALDTALGTKSGLAQAGLLLSEDFLKQNGEFVAALDKDLTAAVQWVKENGKGAAELASQYMPAPAPALELAFPHSGLTNLRTKDISEDVLKFLHELYALNPKITGGKEPTADLFG